jgi:NADP-dependent 3-hydroxy acid dehydrogenase YdfG
MKIIVTGASAGLGRGLATWFCQRGHVVGWLGRNRERLEKAAKSASGSDPAILGRQHLTEVDLTDIERIGPSLTDLAKRMDGVDVLVNNAAEIDTRPLPDLNLAEIDRIARTNLGGTAMAIRALLGALAKSTNPHVINVSSINGNLDPLSRGSLYNASKFALKGMSYALAEELRPLGIRVTHLAPGPIDSQSKRHENGPPRDHSWKLPVSALAEAIDFAVHAPPSVDVTELELKPTRAAP